jgi:hypothetical protein
MYAEFKTKDTLKESVVSENQKHLGEGIKKMTSEQSMLE